MTTHLPPGVTAVGVCSAPGRVARHAVKFSPGGRVLVDADIRDYEGRNNPDRGADDTNPFGVLAAGRRSIETDAGGNSLQRV